MRKILKWPDGTQREISPLSFEEWVRIGLWSGADDTSYNAWLYANNFTDPRDLTAEALMEATLVISDAPDLKFASGTMLGWQPYSHVYDISVRAQQEPTSKIDALKLAAHYKRCSIEEINEEVEAYG